MDDGDDDEDVDLKKCQPKAKQNNCDNDMIPWILFMLATGVGRR